MRLGHLPQTLFAQHYRLVLLIRLLIFNEVFLQLDEQLIQTIGYCTDYDYMQPGRDRTVLEVEEPVRDSGGGLIHIENRCAVGNRRYNYRKLEVAL